MNDTLYLGNSHDVTLPSVTDRTGAVQTGLTVTWEVYAEEVWTTRPTPGAPDATGSMTHDSGGTYRGVIAAADVSGYAVGDFVWVRVKALSGATQVGDWWLRRVVAVRTADGCSTC